MCQDENIHKDCPYGGLSIVWKTSIDHYCSVVEYDDPRLLGLEIGDDGHKVLIVNIYMPYDCCDNENDFMYYMRKVNDIIDLHSIPNVCIMGDFNANIGCTNVSHFGNILNNFCNDENIVIADKMFLDSEAFTFVSNAHNTWSWSDHVVTTHTGCSIINSIEVFRYFVNSDHISMYTWNLTLNVMKLSIMCVLKVSLKLIGYRLMLMISKHTLVKLRILQQRSLLTLI